MKEPYICDSLHHSHPEARFVDLAIVVVHLQRRPNPKLEKAIKEFWFYDLRTTAVDGVGDERCAQAATDLLGHDSQRATSRHYRRTGIIVEPRR